MEQNCGWEPGVWGGGWGDEAGWLPAPGSLQLVGGAGGGGLMAVNRALIRMALGLRTATRLPFKSHPLSSPGVAAVRGGTGQ